LAGLVTTSRLLVINRTTDAKRVSRDLCRYNLT
jgi:hypothetical protein